MIDIREYETEDLWNDYISQENEGNEGDFFDNLI